MQIQTITDGSQIERGSCGQLKGSNICEMTFHCETLGVGCQNVIPEQRSMAPLNAFYRRWMPHETSSDF